MSASLHCPACWRSGNTDDAIELGGPCQDEECDGTIEATPESIAEHEYVKPPSFGEADYFRLELGLPMNTDEIVSVAKHLRTLGWDTVADQILEELSDWTVTA